MDDQLIRRLIEIDNTFYATHAASFSSTRQAPWPGWNRVLACAAAAHPNSSPLTVIDLAAGNLRFERLLASTLAGRPSTVHALDDCPALVTDVPADLDLHVHQVDALAALLDGRDPLGGIPAADLVVCFGFMHHVPSWRLRVRLADALAAHTAPGGTLALSFWRFLDLPALAARADAMRSEAARRGIDLAALEEGDAFLGWQDDASALRYCHHTSEAELDRIAEHLAQAGLREQERFSADGRTGALNRYLVCTRR